MASLFAVFAQLALGVGYDSDLDSTQEIILQTASEVDGARDDPRPQAWSMSSATRISILPFVTGTIRRCQMNGLSGTG